MKDSPWTYAKTMPECPHEYILRRKAKDEPLFERVMHIRRYGHHAQYKGSPRTYFDLDGWQYWTGAPLSSTILVNRAKLP